MESAYHFGASSQARQTAICGRPLAAPGVPETREYIREYMLRGMLKDDEIGLDSDVARIAWSGA